MRTDPSCCPRQGEVRDPRPCLRWLLHLFTSVLVLGKQKSDVFRTANSQDVFEVLYAIVYKFCACSPSQHCSSNVLRRISALSGQSLTSQGISYFVWDLCSHYSCPLPCQSQAKPFVAWWQGGVQWFWCHHSPTPCAVSTMCQCG